MPSCTVEEIRAKARQMRLIQAEMSRGFASYLGSSLSATGSLGQGLNFGETLARFARVDCLANAAAVNRPAAIYEADEGDWDQTIRVNLTGSFLLTRAVAGAMMRQKSGRIVHIGSTASHTATSTLSAYAASKHGLVGLDQVERVADLSLRLQ